MLVGCLGGGGGTKAEVQVPSRELHTHIHLDQARVEILSRKKKKRVIENGGNSRKIVNSNPYINTRSFPICLMYE